MKNKETLIRLIQRSSPNDETVSDLIDRLGITLRDFFILRADPRLSHWDDYHLHKIAQRRRNK